MIEELVKKYQVSHDKKVLEEIIRESKDIIDFYLNTLDLNYEEMYDYAIEGLIKAIISYNCKWKLFFNYADKHIKRAILSNLGRETNDDENLFSSFLEIKKIIENRYGVTLEKDFSIFDDILEEMIERGIFTRNEYEIVKRNILIVLQDYNKSLIPLESFEDYSDIPFDLDFDIPNLQNLLITILGERKYLMLAYQYGLFGLPKLTQREIGEKFNLKTSTIHDHNINSLRKIQMYFRNINNKHTEGDYYAKF